jgi:surface antigen
MQDGLTNTKTLILGSFLAVCCPVLGAHASSQSHARTAAQHPAEHHATLHSGGSRSAVHAAETRSAGHHLRAAFLNNAYLRSNAYQTRVAHVRFGHFAYSRQVVRGGGISCVPYARQVSGIEVGGNAWQWWENAEGRYARGRVPEAGSVLAFRANGRMRLGHVAVVSQVINAREIEVDQANWGRGTVSHGVAVVDVSEANNWTAVRVGLSRDGDFGSVYPTYGFIYARPDAGPNGGPNGGSTGGIVEANDVAPQAAPALNPAPSDLRPAAERPWRVYEEVAEAPAPRTRPAPLASVDRK